MTPTSIRPRRSQRVAHPVTGDESGPLRGKLDTGADVTVIPERWSPNLTSLPKETCGHAVMMALTHSALSVRMTVEGLLVASARCIATARNDVLLGRNVLNCFFITLDGKRQTFSLAE